MKSVLSPGDVIAFCDEAGERLAEARKVFVDLRRLAESAQAFTDQLSAWAGGRTVEHRNRRTGEGGGGKEAKKLRGPRAEAAPADVPAKRKRQMSEAGVAAIRAGAAKRWKNVREKSAPPAAAPREAPVEMKPEGALVGETASARAEAIGPPAELGGGARRMLEVIENRHWNSSFAVDEVDSPTLNRVQKIEALKELVKAGRIRVSQRGRGRQQPRYLLEDRDAAEPPAPAPLVACSPAPGPTNRFEAVPRRRSGAMPINPQRLPASDPTPTIVDPLGEDGEVDAVRARTFRGREEGEGGDADE